MRALSAAAAVPQMAVDMVLKAEEWTEKSEDFIIPPQWETMDAKFGNELKKVIKDITLSREVATLEEKKLRQHRQQLSGITNHAPQGAAVLCAPLNCVALLAIQRYECVGFFQTGHYRPRPLSTLTQRH